MRRYDTVLLDADNTLFDFDRAEELALRWLLRTLDLPEEEGQRYLAINRELWHLRDLGGITAEELVVERFRRFLRETGAQGDPAELNRDYLRKLGECPALLPGAEELCRTLVSAGCTLAIVTNGMPAVQRSRMAHSGIADCFRGLFISGEMGCSKPDRAFFEQVFRTLGLGEKDKPRTVMVGDNLLTDVAGGLRFGLSAVWYDIRGTGDCGGIVPTCRAETLSAVADHILGSL